MKKLFIICISMIVFGVGLQAHSGCEHDFNFDGIHCDDRDYEFDDDCIYIYSEYNFDEYIKITSEMDLYVNGELINTGYSDTKILEKYYCGLREIRKRAVDLGCEGAKLGLKGARIGILAVAKLPMVFLGNADEFERDIEKEAAKIELEAEKIEKRGEALENFVDEVEELESDLKYRIEELDDLDWF